MSIILIVFDCQASLVLWFWIFLLVEERKWVEPHCIKIILFLSILLGSLMFDILNKLIRVNFNFGGVSFKLRRLWFIRHLLRFSTSNPIYLLLFFISKLFCTKLSSLVHLLDLWSLLSFIQLFTGLQFGAKWNCIIFSVFSKFLPMLNLVCLLISCRMSLSFLLFITCTFVIDLIIYVWWLLLL